MPAAAARADNNNRRASGLRRWRKTCAIMTKGLTDSNALHPTIPEDQTGFVSLRRSALNSYERAPKLILPLLPLLFTEQILTVIVLLQACCLWSKNDGVNAIVTTQRSSKSVSDNVSVQLSTVDNGKLPVWSTQTDFVGPLLIELLLLLIVQSIHKVLLALYCTVYPKHYEQNICRPTDLA